MRNQTVAPEQNVLVASVPGAQCQHVLGSVFRRKHDAGEALIGGRFYELIGLGGTDDGDLIAKAPGRAGHVQEHDLAAAHVTVIGSDVEFFQRSSFTS